MARVIHLGQLAPEDVVLDYGDGRRYSFPGDTPALTMIKLHRINGEAQANQTQIIALEEAGEDASDLGERQIELTRELDAEILALLRIRQPDLAETGMSSEQLGWMLGALISGFREQAGEDPPPPPSRAARRTRTPRPKPTSKRSSGSASS